VADALNPVTLRVFLHVTVHRQRRSKKVALIKLDPGLIRNIERRTENQLFVQSLLEVCKSTPTNLWLTR
jgi:hypothetical protein